MTPVFGHGRLRLYLLKLLDEEPRHGYDIIRLLEDRFLGTYAPSAGTIYPRLQRLEAEGMVIHEIREGRKVYRLTDRGRDELRARSDELLDLEASIGQSLRDLAGEIKVEVHGSLRDIRDELKQAAREIRREQRHEKRRRRYEEGSGSGDQVGQVWSDMAKEWQEDLRTALRTTSSSYAELERELARFRNGVRRIARDSALSEPQVRECVAVLSEAYERIAVAIRGSRDKEPGV